MSTKERAATGPAAVYLRHELIPMRRRVSVSLAFAEAVKDLLQFAQSRDDDANRQNAQFLEKPKVVQVAIIEFGFVVPLDLDADSVLEIVDAVRWDWDDFAIDLWADDDNALLHGLLLSHLVHQRGHLAHEVA